MNEDSCTTPRLTLRHRLADRAASGPLLAPGAYDALSALLIQQAGFEAVYMTGFGTSASMLGRPDLGLLDPSEMIDNARRIAENATVALIADADTGYGNVLNVMRTVDRYERAGAAAIHLEDQTFPKRCGHMADKTVIPPPEMEAKIRAAVGARSDPEFLIIARTDASAVEGHAAALDRARRYRDAGADALFVEALETTEQIERTARTFPDVPLVFNWVEGGRTPAVPLETLGELGYGLVIFPLTALLSATRAMQRELRTLRRDGTPANLLDELPSFDEFTELVGLRGYNDLAEEYGR